MRIFSRTKSRISQEPSVTATLSILSNGYFFQKFQNSTLDDILGIHPESGIFSSDESFNVTRVYRAEIPPLQALQVFISIFRQNSSIMVPEKARIDFLLKSQCAAFRFSHLMNFILYSDNNNNKTHNCLHDPRRVSRSKKVRAPRGHVTTI